MVVVEPNKFAEENCFILDNIDGLFTFSDEIGDNGWWWDGSDANDTELGGDIVFLESVDSGMVGDILIPFMI